MTLKITK